MIDNQSAFTSAEYDEQIKRTLPCYDEFDQQVVDVIRCLFCHSISWLDVGCGTGKMAEVALHALDIKRFVFC